MSLKKIMCLYVVFYLVYKWEGNEEYNVLRFVRVIL